VKGAAQHGGRKPEFVMGCDQMLGALGRPRPPAPRWWPGLASANPCNCRRERRCRHRQNGGGGSESARTPARSIARQERPVGLGFGPRLAKSSRRSSADRLFRGFPAIAAQVAARILLADGALRPRVRSPGDP
jgi:hypothetical protein